MPTPFEEQEKRATILLVDDEHELRKLLVKLLEAEGFCVVSAAQAAEAMEILQRGVGGAAKGCGGGIDLALLDVALPDMNGMTLFAKMQRDERLRQIPVIFLTGDSEYQQKARAFEAGAADYITKPFQKKDLILRIRAHIRERRQREREQKKAEGITSSVRMSLDEAQQRFSAVVRNSFHLVCELDPELKVVYASPNHGEILSRDPCLLAGAWWPGFVHPDEQQELIETLTEILGSDSEKRILLRFHDGGNHWRWLDVCASALHTHSGQRHVLLVSRDITHAKETERYLQHLALHDSLTGLANRQRFTGELEAIFAESRGGGAPYAVIYIDVDNFKLINDRHGHLVGDQVLRAVGEFLKQAFGEDAVVVSRFGGDEFCIIVRAKSHEEAGALGERTCERIARNPILSSGLRHRITLSLGLALMESGLSLKEVLSRANTALHAAKSSGKNRCCVYHSDSTELLRIRNSAEWFQRLQEGLEESRFEAWYQPLVDLKTGKTRHCEALIRYRDADGHIHGPVAFLDAAERYGLMPQIDRYMIRRVFSDMVNFPELDVAINLSGSSVTGSGIADYILQCFNASGIAPSRVIFEITETVFMTNLLHARAIVERLQEFGCRFALDDFGTGFSSLNYLRNLPVSLVKIDGSFIREIDSDPVSLTLLKSINEIVHLLGKQTVAEWIENKATLQRLQQIECDYGQGCYCGKPVPLKDLIRRMNRAAQPRPRRRAATARGRTP